MINWKIPSEAADTRLEELYEYLDRFPDSLLRQAVLEEIEYLEEVLKYGY